MNYFKLNEKLLKHNLKNKRSITLSLVVAFLITGQIGGFFETELFARDLRVRQKQNNDIRPDTGPNGPTMSESANKMDVVNIVNPNTGGISHNKFIDFSVGSGNGVIFNNNSTGNPYVSKTGGIVSHNPNLKNSASAILSEVTGNKTSAINGTIEIAGQKADFILANENGITVNGGGFINTSGVTLTTGKPTVTNSGIDLNVQKGNILVEGAGVGASGDYFNIISKTIELRGQVASFEGEKDTDITLLAGQNKVNLANGKRISKYEVIGQQKDADKKYGIYADKLGSMYGKNIKLISTTEGLGVRHEGVIKSSEDIEILSNGDIELGGLRAEKNITVKGKGNLKTISGSFKNSGIEYNYSIYADNGVEIAVTGDIEVETVIQAEKTDLKIVGKNLTLKAGATAKLLSQKGLIIKVSGVTTVEKLLVPIRKNGKDSDAPLVVLKDKNGKIIVKDPYTERILNSNEIEWVSSGIYGNKIDLETGNLNNDGVISTGTNSRDNYIKIKATNQIKNNKLISSSGDLDIEARKIVNSTNSSIRGAAVKIKASDIQNAGEMRQNVGNKGETVDRSNKIEIDIQSGKLTNTGVISGYNVDIKGTGFILNEKDGKIEASTQDYPKGLGTIVITASDLDNKGVIQSHGQGVRNNITINTKTLINAFGAKIVAKKGNLSITTTLGDLLNSGELFADKDVTLLSAKDINNSGKIGGENITITATYGKFENYGKIAAVKKLMVHVNNLINAGTPEEISKYLTAFNAFVQENYDNVVKIIDELEKKIDSTVVVDEAIALESILDYYKNLQRELSTLKYEVERVGALGILSGNEVNLKSNTDILNKGIVKSETTAKLEATNNINNNGVVEGTTDVTLKAGKDIANTQRLYAGKNLTIEGRSFTSSGSENLVAKYVDLMTKYDEKALENAEAKIKELEKQLNEVTDKVEIERLKAELEKYRVIKKEQARYKAEIITIEKLGVIESENLTVQVTDKIENNGIVIAKKDLTLKSTNGEIVNNSNISAGQNAMIEGNSFKNKALTVGGDLTAKVNGAFDSESLTIGKNATINANTVNIKKDLSVGEKTQVNLGGTNASLKLENGSKGNLKKDFTVKGGEFTNQGELVVGGKATIDTSSNTSTLTSSDKKSFTNEGKFDVTGDLDIKSEGFKNTDGINTGGNISIDAGSGKFENANKLQAKGNGNFTSQGFLNNNEIVLGGKATINAGSGDVENKSFEAKDDIKITTTGNVKNTEKLNTSGKLDIKGKNFENASGAEVVNKGTDITVTEGIKNDGNIEVTGDISLKGTGANSKLDNTGNIKATDNGSIDIKGDLNNTGTLATGKKLDIKASSLTNKNTLQAGEGLKAELTKNFSNDTNSKVLGGNIEILAKEAENGSGFVNRGTIQSNGNLTVDLGNKNIDINFTSGSKMSSQGTMTIKTGGAITNDTKLQNFGSLDFTAGKDITNKGMIVSNGDIKLKGQNILNETGTSIWAARTLVIEAVEKIWNKLRSTIESKGDMTLTAGHLLNEAGSIKTSGNLVINANQVENKSEYTGSGFKEIETWVGGAFAQEYKGVAGLILEHHVDITMPIYESDLRVTDKATIASGGNLTINGKNGSQTDMTNLSGSVTAKGNISVTGNLKNETMSASMTIEEYLKNIKIKAWWWQKFGANSPGQSGVEYEMSLYEAITNNKFQKYRVQALALVADKQPELKKLLNTALGPDWNTKSDFKDMYKNNGKYTALATNGTASIRSGGSFTLTGGKFENISGDKVENTAVDVSIGENNVTGTQANLGVSVKDPNSITEVDGVKQVHDVEIQTGTVTINGVTITAGSGGGVSSIAVAGTINPIVFIDIPVGENGIFKPAAPRPNGSVPYLFETNIDFIDVSKYYGSDYFFKQSGYDPNKTPTVIGDAYYEQQLINNTIREGLGYSGEVSTDHIKVMLDNALNVKDKLGLEVGKPLTPEQINNLDEDIVWYVEMEVQGQIVLVPQVYFGKDTRLKMAAADTGAGVGSSVQAGGDINIDATEVVNSNGNISSGGNIDIKSEKGITNNSSAGINGGISAKGDVKLDAKENIDMIGGNIKSENGGVDVKAGGDINIESTLGYDENGNQTVSNQAGISAKGDVSVKASGDTTIKGGVVESTDGNVALGGKNVTIEDQNIITSGTETTTDGITTTTKSFSKSTSSGSGIGGKNVTIEAENDVTIKGSGVAAKEEVSIKAGDKVNIVDGQDYYHETTKSQISGTVNGLITTGSAKSETTASKSKGSTVGGLGGLKIESGGDTTIKGSDLIAGDSGIDIKSGGKVDILDGQDTLKSTSNSATYNGLGFTGTSEKTSSTTSKGSGLTTTGGINIESKDGVKSVGTEFTAGGDMNIKTDGDVSFEAGKNTYESEKSSISVGVTNAGASAGAGGSSASAGWNPLDGGSTEVINGDPVQVGKDSMIKGNSKAGKNYMDALTDASVQIGVSMKNSSEKSTTWTEGSVKTGGNLNITSGGKTDIGGSDFETGGDFTIKAKSIDTTKYEDVVEKKSSGLDIGVTVKNSTTSSIADAVNKGMQIADSAKDGAVNEALAAAQVAGSVTNVIFGDLAGNTTSVTGNIGWNSSNSKTTKENTTNIKSGGKLQFEATDGNIDLKGVQAEANDVSLSAKNGEINITDAKETVTEHSKGVNISGGVTASVGVGAIDGANAQLGVTGNVSYNQSDVNNEYSKGSSIVAKNGVSIESGKNTNIIGSTVEGNNVDLKVGGDLNIETKVDKIDESRIEAWLGADVSAGVATNTIGTGDLGLSAGGGQIFKKGSEVTTQAGIKAKNEITAKVEGDANLKGGVLGSETGAGNVDIGGNLNVSDVKTDLNAGGAIIGISGGTKGGGIQGEVGDVIDKKQTAKSGINVNPDNITVGGDVTVNGGSGDKNNVGVDMKNSLTTDKDIYKQGGTFSGTASAIPGKKKGSGDTDQVAPPTKKTDTDIQTPIKKNPDPVESKKQVVETPKVDKVQVVDPPKKQVVETVPPPTEAKVVEVETPKQKATETEVPKKEVPTVETPKKVDVDVVDGKTPETPKPVIKDGYQKNPETGKWEKVTPETGAKLTNGFFGSMDSLKGFQQGIKKGTVSSDGGPATGSGTTAKAPSQSTPDVSAPQKAPDTGAGKVVVDSTPDKPITNGGYTKNPETGKWEKPHTEGGAKLTNGFFGSNSSLKGFQDGAKSLGGVTGGSKANAGSSVGGAGTTAKAPSQSTPDVSAPQKAPSTGSGKAVADSTLDKPITNNGYTKNPETGMWEKTHTDGGVKATNGFFGSSNAVKGFQDGAKSLGSSNK